MLKGSKAMSWKSVLVLSSSMFAVACGGGGHDRPPANPGEHSAHGDHHNERRDDARDRRREDNTRWDKLGERWVDGKNDRDVVPVGRADGKFEAIQLKVENSALELDDVKVVFGDGSVFEPKTRLVFGNGATSRVIDLPGGKRVVQRVEFRYANLPGGGRAQIELWGR